MKSEDLFDTSSEGSNGDDEILHDDGSGKPEEYKSTTKQMLVPKKNEKKKSSKSKSSSSLPDAAMINGISKNKPSVGLHVEACDKEGIWSLARIVEVKKKSKKKKNFHQVKISYDGWGSEWDELVDFYNVKRIALPGTYTVRFKCMAHLLDGHVSGKCTEWPCVVNVRTPTILAGKAQFEFAEESLRLEQNIFIEPYGMKYLPQEISASSVNGGRWVNIETISEWGNPSDIESKHSKKLANNFYSAFKMASNDDLPKLPGDAFAIGTLLQKKFRTKFTKLKKENKEKTGKVKKSIAVNEGSGDQQPEKRQKKKKRSQVEMSDSEKDITTQNVKSKAHENKKSRTEKSMARKSNANKTPSRMNESNDRTENETVSKKRKLRDRSEKKIPSIPKGKDASKHGERDYLSSETHLESSNKSPMEENCNGKMASSSPVKLKRKKSRDESGKGTAQINDSKTNTQNRGHPKEKRQGKAEITAIPRKKRRIETEKENLKALKNLGDRDTGKPHQDMDYLSLLLNTDDVKTDLVEKKATNSIRQKMQLKNPNMFRIPKKHNPNKELTAEKSNMAGSKERALSSKYVPLNDTDKVQKDEKLSTSGSTTGTKKSEKQEKLRMMVRSLKERVSKRAPLPEVNARDKKVKQSRSETNSSNKKPKSSVALSSSRRSKKKLDSDKPHANLKDNSVEKCINRPIIYDPLLWIQARGPKTDSIGFGGRTSSGLTMWLKAINLSEDKSHSNLRFEKIPSSNTSSFKEPVLKDAHPDQKPESNIDPKHKMSVTNDTSNQSSICTIVSNESRATFHAALETNAECSNPDSPRKSITEDAGNTPDYIEEPMNVGNDKSGVQNDFQGIVSLPEGSASMSISSSNSCMSISISNSGMSVCNQSKASTISTVIDSVDEQESGHKSMTSLLIDKGGNKENTQKASKEHQIVGKSHDKKQKTKNIAPSDEQALSPKNTNSELPDSGVINAKVPSMKTGKPSQRNNDSHCQESLKTTSGSQEIVVNANPPSSDSSLDTSSSMKNIRTKQKDKALVNAAIVVNETPSLSEESKEDDKKSKKDKKSRSTTQSNQTFSHGNISQKHTSAPENETVLMAVMRCRKMMNADELTNNSDMDSPIIDKKIQNLDTLVCDSSPSKQEVRQSGSECDDKAKSQMNEKYTKKSTSQPINTSNNEHIVHDLMIPSFSQKQAEPTKAKKLMKQPLLSIDKKQSKTPTMTHAQIFAQLKAKRREAKNKMDRRRTVRKGSKKAHIPPRILSDT